MAIDLLVFAVMDDLRSGPGALTRKVTRLFVRGTDEKYAFPAHAAPRLTELAEAAGDSSTPVASVGALLKLVHVLRTRHDSPTAADTLLDALMSAPGARQVILTRWTGGRKPRRGADLQPIEQAFAPHVDAAKPKEAVKLSSMLDPTMDPRTRMLQTRASKGRRS